MIQFPENLKVEIVGADVVTLKGEPGIQGEQGEKGDQGIQGEKGETGEKGEKGEAGKNGIDGIDGQDGEKGEPGEKGERGEKGEKGDTGTFDESQLEKFENEIKSLRQQFAEAKPIFGPGKTKIIQVDLSSQLDGITKTFSLGFSHFGIVGVYGSSSPFIFRPIVDYTESGRNIVFDSALDASIALAAGQTLIVKVLK